MKLHELSSIKKRVQRVGRGGKRGTTAGRGTKGQHSRAGRRMRPAERDLILRIPKRRGFRNKPKSDKAIVLSLEALSKMVEAAGKGKPEFEITMAFLRTAGAVPKSFSGEVKVLGGGEAAFPLILKGISASESAKKKIVKAGGSVSS